MWESRTRSSVTGPEIVNVNLNAFLSGFGFGRPKRLIRKIKDLKKL